MRAVRVVVGLLALLVAVPALAAGGGAAWLSGHDSPDGAFHAAIAPPKDPNRVLVVPDLDALLQRDVPYVRVGTTTLRLSASSASTPAFIGVAAPDEVAAYLAGIRYTEVAQTVIGTGPVVLRTNRMDAPGRDPRDPLAQGFWLRQGLGSLSWNPQLDRGRHLALVVVLRDTPAGEAALPSDAATLDVALSASWLGSASWGLLILGMVLLILAFVTLSWPARVGEPPADTDGDGALTALLSDHTRPVLPGDPDAVTVLPAPEQRAPRETKPGVRSPQEPDDPARQGFEPDRRAPLTVPWAGAPYTGPAAAPMMTCLQAAATVPDPRLADTVPGIGLGDTMPGVLTAEAVAGAVPAMRTVAVPELPWPPLRGTLPATEPVREVITEEFLRVWLPRPGCELRLDRSRQRA